MKITDLDFEQSLLRKRLIFKPSWSYKFDLIFQIFANLALSISLLSLSSIFKYGVNEKSFALLYLIFVLCFNCLLFLKLTEKRLSVIQTNNTEVINRDRILTLAKQEDWIIKRDSKNILITFEDCGDIGFGNNKEQTRVFLFAGDEVLFTIFTERRRVNFPSPLAKRYMRSDLKKILATN